jgi:hypothetical protein
MRYSDRSQSAHEPWLPGWALALGIAVSGALLAWLHVIVLFGG